MGESGFKQLDVWKVSMELVLDVYRATRTFPDDEKFGLVSQLRRAVVSISANIAEGYGRQSPGAYCQHLRIAKGSNNEVEALCIVSNELGFLRDFQSIEVKTVRIGQMLSALIRSLEGNVVREIDSHYGVGQTSDFDDDPL